MAPTNKVGNKTGIFGWPLDAYLAKEAPPPPSEFNPSEPIPIKTLVKIAEAPNGGLDFRLELLRDFEDMYLVMAVFGVDPLFSEIKEVIEHMDLADKDALESVTLDLFFFHYVMTAKGWKLRLKWVPYSIHSPCEPGYYRSKDFKYWSKYADMIPAPKE